MSTAAYLARPVNRIASSESIPPSELENRLANAQTRVHVLAEQIEQIGTKADSLGVRLFGKIPRQAEPAPKDGPCLDGVAHALDAAIGRLERALAEATRSLDRLMN